MGVGFGVIGMFNYIYFFFVGIDVLMNLYRGCVFGEIIFNL